MTPTSRPQDRPQEYTGTSNGDRAQTGVDFVVGVGIFLLTVAFVVSFVPGLMAPFDGEATTTPLVADRVADDLVYDVLAADGRPGVLDEAATLALFASDADATAADYDLDAAHLNVSLRKDVDATPGREILTTDGTDVTYAPGDTPLVLGDPVPTSGASVSTAIRVVTIDGTDAVLEVRTW